MGRIIKPSEISILTNNIALAIEEDKIRLASGLFETNVFLCSDEFQGNAWSSVKTQVGNHNIIIRGLLCMLDELLISCSTLKLNCGEEELNEDVLIEHLNYLKNQSFIFEMQLYNAQETYSAFYGNITDNANSEEGQLLFSQVALYNRLLELTSESIIYYEDKLNKLEEIDLSIKEITNDVEQLQNTIKVAIAYLKSSWNEVADCYLHTTETTQLAWYQTLNNVWQNKIIKEQSLKEIQLTDAEKLELSRLSNDIYISNNYQSLYYKGNIYKLYVPKQDGTQYIESEYSVVYSIEENANSFNISEAILNIEFEDPDLQPVYLGNNVVYTPKLNSTVGVAFIVDSLLGALSSGIDTIDIKIQFETSTSGQYNRAIIYVGTYEQRTNAQSTNYNMPISLYNKNTNNIPAQIEISKAALNIYNDCTGQNIEAEGLEVYDFEATLNTERSNLEYFSYISFDNEGNVIETPIRLPGEKVYITVRDTKLSSPKNILDITDATFQSFYVDSDEYSDLIQMMLEGM